MTGFEPRTSGIGSDRSINSATTTAVCNQNIYNHQSKSWQQANLILDIVLFLPNLVSLTL